MAFVWKQEGLFQRTFFLELIFLGKVGSEKQHQHRASARLPLEDVVGKRQVPKLDQSLVGATS